YKDVLNKDLHLKGKWCSHVFHNSNPITLELGCGKGEYTVGLAKRFPKKNFIGIDIKGARMWKGAKTANESKIENAAFLRTRIEFINSFFAENEIDEIWITFPDPQMKKRREKKRLSGAAFLNRYKQFLTPEGIVHLKTDSLFLHKYTLEVIKENNLPLLYSSDNIYAEELHSDALSIRTFYETFFLKNGKNITYLKFQLKTNKELQNPKINEELFYESLQDNQINTRRTS
ncbi:MAG: tRNA (guanosine(46)-N7)-methyltransferase TrmB, partial [Marinilabiliales bacterium]